MKKIGILLASIFLLGVCCTNYFADAKIDSKNVSYKLREQQFVTLQIECLRKKISCMDFDSAISALKYVESLLMEIRKDSSNEECFENFLELLRENRDKICVAEKNRKEYDALYDRIWYYRSIPSGPKIRPIKWEEFVRCAT